jgi:hypothetical protein
MSTNITHVETLALDAWISAADVAVLQELRGAECSFIDDLIVGEDGRAVLKNFWWYGECSGNSYDDTLIEQVCPLIHGRVEAIFYWEGGDFTTGLIVQDGVVTECEVKKVLVPKVPQ